MLGYLWACSPGPYLYESINHRKPVLSVIQFVSFQYGDQFSSSRLAKKPFFKQCWQVFTSQFCRHNCGENDTAVSKLKVLNYLKKMGINSCHQEHVESMLDFCLSSTCCFLRFLIYFGFDLRII